MRHYLNYFLAAMLLVFASSTIASTVHGEEQIDYAAQVQPILNKYCVGCHNPDDLEGELSLASYADLGKGITDGPAVLAGQPKSSRLFRVIAGLAEPKMPPDELEGPNSDELALLELWIESGAAGPDETGAKVPSLIVPSISSTVAASDRPITALAVSSQTGHSAVARFAHVQLQEPASEKAGHHWQDFPGKVNAISFSRAGDLLVAASGVVGLYGQADLFDVSTGAKLRSIVGHRDTLYDAQLSPDGQMLATASYDGKIMIWDAASGAELKTIAGHNGAVFDIEFDPSGRVLASASADATIKLWNVVTGERLDTLSQPLAEQYTVMFSPDGKYIVGGGADSRIRVWQFVSRDEKQINPLVYTRFAHEGAVTNLEFARDGEVLVSTGADRIVRAWETESYAQSEILTKAPAAIHALAVRTAGDKLLFGLMDGSILAHSVAALTSEPRNRDQPTTPEARATPDSDEALTKLAEQEPNDDFVDAQVIEVPATIRGVVEPSDGGPREDVDYFRFRATAGEQWIIEIKAARKDSKLDSLVEILNSDGQRIERVLLQAVRDSYFTFRGKNSTQSDDFRVHNWEEMQLNEYIYCGGEVSKLWAYPRGPDSGFNVYPGHGNRYTYFGTSGVAHALNEPAYIVEVHQPGESLVPTGLPVFPVYFENDDDPQRRHGADSYVDFTAPADGEYLIKLRDVRGFGGKDFNYELIVRRPQPSFSVSLSFDKGNISPGSGKEFTVNLTREDGFDGAVRIDIDGLPEGFQASTPVVVEAGQVRAFGVVNARLDASQPTSDEIEKIRVVASAEIAGEDVSHDVEWSQQLKLGGQPEIFVQIFPATSDPPKPQTADVWTIPTQPLELTVAPGQTISAIVRAKRKDGFTDRVSFGTLGAGRNLPHGVYVDNIGLNGLMIVNNSNEREFFITADSWVPETTQRFHLRTEQSGNQTTWPVILHVRK